MNKIGLLLFEKWDLAYWSDHNETLSFLENFHLFMLIVRRRQTEVNFALILIATPLYRELQITKYSYGHNNMYIVDKGDCFQF